MWPKNLPPPPPVPAKVREMLKDYPEVIEDLQEGLNNLVGKMLGQGTATLPFDRAIWLLKDSLGDHYADALEEWRAAEASGDPQAIERTEEKSHRIGLARHEVAGDDLEDYFDTYRRAFEWAGMKKASSLRKSTREFSTK